MIAGFVIYKPQDTARKCSEHPSRVAIGYLISADQMGNVDRSSRTPACAECAAKGGYKGSEAA